MVELTTSVNNFTTYITNTQTGASVALTKSTSDLELVGKLCTEYHTWLLVQSIVLLTVILLKGFLHRMLLRNPKPWMKNLYEKADNIIDMLFIVLAIVQLGVSIAALL